MAVGLPLKTTYADGDVYSASDVNDTNGTINANVNPFTAGKNKIINGDFYVNQRGFTSGTSYDYGFDRFVNAVGGGTGTATFSAQTFTPGTAPVAGYEGKNYIRCVTTGQTAAGTFTIFQQNIEDVRTLAGQTATISFWAKAATGTPKIFAEFEQGFGSGGSANVNIGNSVTISTSWARYSVTLSVPSISGKTIGSSSLLSLLLWVSGGSSFNTRTGSLGIQSNTFEIWGVQVEAGSTATPFQTATGTIQGELAACQRYYYRANANGTPYGKTSMGGGNSSTAYWGDTDFPVAMRVAPTAVDTSTLSNYRIFNYADTTAGTPTAIVLDTNISTNTNGRTLWTTSGLTANVLYYSRGNNTASSYLGFSAEL
jgi:hypothetical protein